MDDLISREDVIALLNKWADGYWYIETPTADAVKKIEGLPSIDSVKHGRWIHWYGYITTIYKYRCSICGAFHRERYDYCPTCGACMDAENCNNTKENLQ